MWHLLIGGQKNCFSIFFRGCNQSNLSTKFPQFCERAKIEKLIQ